MASRAEYTVGGFALFPWRWRQPKRLNDTNTYILGRLNGHNIVVACLPVGVYGTTSAATVATQMLASFKSIRFSLMVGIEGGVPSTKEDIRVGDVVVSKPTAARPGIIQIDFGKRCAEDEFTITGALNKPSTLLLTAAGKVETNTIFGESQIPQYISKIVQKDPLIFARPAAEEDRLFDSQYEHITKPDHRTCHDCDSSRILDRSPRETRNPKVHYGLVASGNQVMRDGGTRDRLARKYGIICFEMEAAGLMDIAQCLVIRGICDYSDSHKLKRWQGYAAAAVAAYAKEILTLIPTAPRPDPLASVTNTFVATVLDALLLTRPEVDRSTLITLKGRRVDGTCEWLVLHPRYQDWLQGGTPPLLWISGGAGKDKTMLAMYITEVLQAIVDSHGGVLLYYFCSNRDKNRNTALTLMRGVLHQWISLHPYLVKHVQSYFDGAETTKYTTSSFICLWRLFLILLRHSRSSKVVLLLDGLDECQEDSVKQLIDVLVEYLTKSEETSGASLQVILLSRPQSRPLESGLRPFRRIKLDDADIEVGKDVEKYISAKAAELASEKILSPDRLQKVRQALMANADGTFLWVGFVADELKGRSWLKVKEILRGVPKGLGGIYSRLLEQVEDKDRPLTLDELAITAEIRPSDKLAAPEILKDLLASCGLLVKIDGDIVNLVHESAKEFFQSEQVNTDSISAFYMNHSAHRTLLRTCLRLIEGNYKSLGSMSNAVHHNSLLNYAGIYWPEHFRHAFDPVDAQFEISRQFFQVKSAAGRAPPPLTLLHLAAYFGNLAWAKALLDEKVPNKIFFRPLTSRTDSYGRTPLFWAASRGHRDLVELLLDNGANINSRDRSNMTALHISIIGEQRDVISLLLERSARIEDKASYNETPLMRAILANSKDIVTLLLEHGARVDRLPTPPEDAPLRGFKDSLEDQANHLLGLQEQLFAARYENQSKQVDTAIKIFTFSLRFQPIFQLVALYVKHMSLGRWEVLQDLVKNNETDRLREWVQSYTKFGNRLVEAENTRNMQAMTGLSVRLFEAVSSADLEGLLVIGVLVGSGVMLTAAQRGWKEGVEISGKTFSCFASLAYRIGAEESLQYGAHQFLVDFDACIRAGKTDESAARTINYK